MESRVGVGVQIGSQETPEAASAGVGASAHVPWPQGRGEDGEEWAGLATAWWSLLQHL